MKGIQISILALLAITQPIWSSAHTSPKDIQIVGGYDIDISQAPYQISLEFKNGHICGGTIVSKDFIVTARHCVKKFKQEELRIRVGSSIRNEGGELHQISKIAWHDGSGSDVAVLKLTKPLKFNENVSAIPMINKDVEIPEGEQTNVTGWGRLKEYGKMATKLQMVQVPIVSQEQCQKGYVNKTIKISMLCAGYSEGGKDACQGDSGGPLVYDGKLAGIVSWGIGCARPELPGVYANVSNLRPWIDEAIANLTEAYILEAPLDPVKANIIGGHTIDISEAPYQASLVYDGEHYCGGTIVAKDIIITAAHCFDQFKELQMTYEQQSDILYQLDNLINFEVRVGSSLVNTGGQLYPVGAIILHGRYNKYHLIENDIAVVWLSIPLQFSDDVKAIPMINDYTEIQEGEETIVTGWGLTGEEYFPYEPTTILQRVAVPIISQKHCNDMYSGMISPSMLCAGLPNGGKDSCKFQIL
ncbi:vitellin-degrading protease-like isoform X2 [Pectinophora gossypiella]|uniref:vitellin-degrading protease-like isoform X2 n=1 Tax=Pectinophora gossypiella TaxID=13191 RepID=UPI00214F45DE|nr:vitellin-degrading protease-like isoform X2 [Pectinophora gossypiella]